MSEKAAKAINSMAKAEKEVLMEVYAAMHDPKESLFRPMSVSDLEILNKLIDREIIIREIIFTNSEKIIWGYMYKRLSPLGREVAEVLYKIDRL